MKTIIAGSRTINCYSLVSNTIEKSGFKITEVVSGTAKGVDMLGEVWAYKNKIPIKRFPANWDKHGRGAGMIRNKQMVDYADALIFVKEGESRGTTNTIQLATDKGIKIFGVYV